MPRDAGTRKNAQFLPPQSAGTRKNAYILLTRGAGTRKNAHFLLKVSKNLENFVENANTPNPKRRKTLAKTASRSAGTRKNACFGPQVINRGRRDT